MQDTMQLDETVESVTHAPGTGLVEWVMGHVDRWRTARDQSFQKRWGEYYRLWRGRWMVEDKNKSSERSRLVAPALSQAIEMTVSELEEATFGREPWIDIVDDPEDRASGATQDVSAARSRLSYDLKRAKVRSEVAASYLHGALYGALVAKVVVEKDKTVSVGKYDGQGREITEIPRVTVRAVAIPADEFVPDPSAEFVEDMLGCAHEVIKPRAWLQRRIADGTYRRIAVCASSGPLSDGHRYERADLEAAVTQQDGVLITEYHGLVPARLLPQERRTEMDAVLDGMEIKTGDETLVEAIVTIADKRELLYAKANTFDRKDRSIVAAPFERVPGRFWGRSIAEKGYNPQKALDAELRSRMDALALISNPMMAADITRLPRGFDFNVRPGKVWLTNGAPKDVLEPVQFAGLDPTTFNQSAELERMVQMGTGAMDTATPLEGNRRNETATGTSLIVGSFVKRAKRAKAHTDENFLEPLIQKIVWRYMEFDPARYPADVDFRMIGTLGIVARELEQAQLTNMLGLVPEGSPAQMILIKAIFDNSSSPHKDEMLAAIEQMMQPDPQAQALAQANAMAELQKLQAEGIDRMASAELKRAQIVETIAKAQAAMQQPGVDRAKLDIEIQKLFVQLRELEEYSRQIDVSALKAHADLIKARKQGSKGE